MSSHSKRRAESEEVAHKKKAQKTEDDEFNQGKEANGVADDDELNSLDEGNIISSSRKTRGKRVDHTEASDISGLENDNGSESERENQKVTKGASAELLTRSPQRKPATDIEEEKDEEYGNEDDEDGDGDDDDSDDDITDEDQEEEEYCK